MASSCRTASRRRATRPGHLDEKRVGRVERLFVDRHSLTGTTNRQSQRRDLDRVHARAAGVPLPTVRRPEVQPWSAAELAQFLRYASTDRLGPVYELIAACELRRGEALGVRWAVDFARRVLYVRQTLTDVGGSSGHGVPMGILSKMLRILDRDHSRHLRPPLRGHRTGRLRRDQQAPRRCARRRPYPRPATHRDHNSANPAQN